MKSLCMALCLAVGLTLAATAQMGDSAAPQGTQVTKQHPTNNEVQPTAKKIRVNSKVIRQAQEKLNDKGYSSGPVTGRMNLATRAAVRKFQADEKLKATGRLDENTLSHLNIGAGTTMGAAPGDVGHGAMAAGHDIKEGHPVAAGKALGKGVGRAGKKVGEGTKSAVVGTKDKMDKDNSGETPAQPAQQNPPNPQR
jgi:peptidoglycan hydrolase-like protein with peptidoglycan-binding domain